MLLFVDIPPLFCYCICNDFETQIIITPPSTHFLAWIFSYENFFCILHINCFWKLQILSKWAKCMQITFLPPFQLWLLHTIHTELCQSLQPFLPSPSTQSPSWPYDHTYKALPSFPTSFSADANFSVCLIEIFRRLGFEPYTSG